MTWQKILMHCALISAAAFTSSAQTQPAELQPKVSLPFRFVAYGDTRFTNPENIEAANPLVRQRLVEAIAEHLVAAHDHHRARAARQSTT